MSQPTAQDLAVTLAALDEQAATHLFMDGPWNYWSVGYVDVRGQRLEIDREASDALAARLGHAGRNEDESRWLVAGGLVPGGASTAERLRLSGLVT